MKKFSFILILVALTITSCDKVKKPFIPGISTELNTSLYPGAWSAYPWPTFTQNTNTNRNVLIEDYTGHKCVFCPSAAVIAKDIEVANPDRVFVASIHASPGGIGPFQSVDASYTNDLTNPMVIAYGSTFQNGFNFTGNPQGTVSRKVFGGVMFQQPGNWSNASNQMITENELKTNLQAKINYFPTTRGVFLHAEIDTMNMASADFSVVVYLIENTFVSKQKFPGGVSDENYVHHNIHRGNIDNRAFGRDLLATNLKPNGKYYLDYSYQLPAQYDPANCHLLVYTMNKATYEIYQVVKVNLQ
ncbi:MAG: Omp28-related outer membrane protein [Crocinitomicaceae bacterium]|nr:Omp28-related outer membrane protein [Crocinitomicaceae bacterium]